MNKEHWLRVRGFMKNPRHKENARFGRPVKKASRVGKAYKNKVGHRNHQG